MQEAKLVGIILGAFVLNVAISFGAAFYSALLMRDNGVSGYIWSGAIPVVFIAVYLLLTTLIKRYVLQLSNVRQVDHNA